MLNVRTEPVYVQVETGRDTGGMEYETRLAGYRQVIDVTEQFETGRDTGGMEYEWRTVPRPVVGYETGSNGELYAVTAQGDKVLAHGTPHPPAPEPYDYRDY